MQHTNSDFKVVVCAPCIEYHVASVNFTFVKTLSRKDIGYLLERNFTNWDNECLYLITSNQKFSELQPKLLSEKFLFYSEVTKDIKQAPSA